ncbi:MAG: hypothetical protein JO036_08505 [Candidatus Eremiobacteraeota bacterium]|nr:hypothetical protein [Candidatus Eremiobacteraeota bacterium]
MSEKIEGKPADGGGDRTNPFLQFLTSLEAVPGQIIEGMNRQTTDEDHKAAIKAYGDAFRAQIQGLSAYLRDEHSRLSPQAQAEVSRVVTMSGSSALFSGVATLSRNLSSTTARLSVSGIIAEIKKIIKVLLGIFHPVVAPWLDGIIALINEILHDLFGIGSPALASTLSRMHQDYMHEQILLARLNRERAAFSEIGKNDFGSEGI